MKRNLVASFIIGICAQSLAQTNSCPVPTISYTANCGDDSTQLFASPSFDTYYWFPGAGLSDSTLQNPVAPFVSGTTYSLVTTVLDAELVINGDFALGNTGFLCDLTYTPWYSPGNYYVAPTFFTTAYALTDVTPTADNFFMSVDGGNPATMLWEQTIPTIDPAQTYDFSFWATKSGATQPIYEIHMIGNVTGDIIVSTLPGLVYSGIWDWDQYSYPSWDSGPNTSVTIRVINLQTASYGNDFALDDFSFRKICIDTTSVTFADDLMNAGFDVTVGCSGTETVFIDTTLPNPNSWLWSFGDGTSSTDQNPQHIFSAPGTYDVTLSVTSIDGCADSVTMSVVVPELPIADFSFVNDCYYDVATFNDLSTISTGSITQWQWNYGDGTVSSSQNGTHQYMTAGTYSVQLIVTSDVGCQASITQSIDRIEAPVANFSSAIVACGQACIPFTDLSTFSSIPVVSWEWNFGNGQLFTTTNPEPCFTNFSNNVNTYDVTLTVTNDSGCQNTLTVSDYIEIFPIPTASFTYSPNTADVSNSTVHFNNTSQFADSYIWNFGDSQEVSTETNPIHEYDSSPNSFLVTLIASSFNDHCIDTLQVMIEILADPVVYVPNSFTPDGDEHNMVFQPILSDGFDTNNYYLVIFNRWGEIVFETYDPAVGWDGTYANSGRVIDGVYSWVLQVRELNSQKLFEHVGHVTLIK